MKVRKCLRSGFCCRQSSCGYAEYDYEKKQCSALVNNKDGTSGCGIYDEIIKDPMSVHCPAFGSGCCSPINRDRDELRENVFGGVEQFIEIDMEY